MIDSSMSSHNMCNEDDYFQIIFLTMQELRELKLQKIDGRIRT